MTALAPERIERDVGAGRPKLIHYEDPEHPGYTYCGIEIRERNVPDAADCVVCCAENERNTGHLRWWEKWRNRRDGIH